MCIWIGKKYFPGCLNVYSLGFLKIVYWFAERDYSILNNGIIKW